MVVLVPVEVVRRMEDVGVTSMPLTSELAAAEAVALLRPEDVGIATTPLTRELAVAGAVALPITEAWLDVSAAVTGQMVVNSTTSVVTVPICSPVDTT